jgi:hypothetical protein
MKILNLKEVLSRGDIQENIKGNMFKTDEEVRLAIEETLKSDKNNVISVEAIREEKPMSFENTLHIDKEKQIYLLESRLFDDKGDGQMKGAYLEVFNSDGERVKEYIDDVWEYANWEVA